MKINEVISGEYEMIESTSFWKRYVSHLMQYRATKSRECETFPADKIAKIQGEIFAIDRIMRLPREIMGSSSEGQKE